MRRSIRPYPGIVLRVWGTRGGFDEFALRLGARTVVVGFESKRRRSRGATRTSTTLHVPQNEPEPAPPPSGSSLDLSQGATAGEELHEVEPEREAGPFSQGSVGLHLGLGTSFFGSRTYLMIGAGVGVQVVDGLELSVDGSIWLFDDPFAGTVTPGLTYTFYFVQAFKPYVGTFFRHYMLGDNIDDFNTLGFRIGGYLAPGRSRVTFGIGLVYEHTLDCNDQIWSCDDFYPELSFSVWF
jgi:hypothetical protein